MELPPEDVYLRTISSCEWLKNGCDKAYLSGALTSINMVRVMVAHGIKHAFAQYWQPFFHYDNSLTAEQVIDKIGSFMADVEGWENVGEWYNLSLFVHPELKQSYYFSQGVNNTAPVLFQAYQYLEANFGQDKLAAVWEKYLADLESRFLQLDYAK